jgi:hypothetical protein
MHLQHFFVVSSERVKAPLLGQIAAKHQRERKMLKKVISSTFRRV